MLSYDATLTVGASPYQDVLQVLREAGLDATFIQTGGMNAALEVMLEGGSTLLVTDAEDSLAWNRKEHEGWGWGCTRRTVRTTTGSAWRLTAPTTGHRRRWYHSPERCSQATFASCNRRQIDPGR